VVLQGHACSISALLTIKLLELYTTAASKSQMQSSDIFTKELEGDPFDQIAYKPGKTRNKCMRSASYANYKGGVG
jgi:hypothetical protein